MIATPATPAIEKIDLSGYLFTPNLVTVAAGKTARFELTGDGLEHTFTIQGLAVDIPVPVGTKSQIVEFIVPAGKSGDFPLICSLHELAGMVGTVRVK